MRGKQHMIRYFKKQNTRGFVESIVLYKNHILYYIDGYKRLGIIDKGITESIGQFVNYYNSVVVDSYTYSSYCKEE